MNYEITFLDGERFPYCHSLPLIGYWLLSNFVLKKIRSNSFGSQDIMCGNVTKFSMAKNDYAHRNLHTGFSLELNFDVSSSFNFRDFSV